MSVWNGGAPGDSWEAVQKAVDNPVYNLQTAWYRPWGPFGLFNAAMHIMVVLVACFPLDWAPSWPFIVVSVAMMVGFWLFAPWRARQQTQAATGRQRIIVRLAPWLYLVALGAGFAYLTWWGSLATLLFFNLFPQCWIMVYHRWEGCAASAWIAACAWVGICVQEGFQPATMASVALQMAFACGISIVAGMWVLSAIDAAVERSLLVSQLRAAQHELAQVNHAEGVRAERERLSREIHDTLAQGFTSLVVLARSAQADLEAGDTARVRERLALIQTTASDNLAEARALVAATAPPSLQVSGPASGGLGEGIRRLAQQHTAATGIPVDVEVPDAVAGDLRAQVAVLRAAGEGLMNVRRHADAQHVSVTVVAAPGALRLLVEDDGTGLPAAVRAELSGLAQDAGAEGVSGAAGTASGTRGQARGGPGEAAWDAGRTAGAGGYGLHGIAARAAELGGTFSTRTGSGGRGTVLELVVPCVAPAQVIAGDDTSTTDDTLQEETHG